MMQEYHQSPKVQESYDLNNVDYNQSPIAVYDFWQERPSMSFSAESAASTSSGSSFGQSSQESPASTPDRRRKSRNSWIPALVIPQCGYYHQQSRKKIGVSTTKIPEWTEEQCVALDAEMVGVGQFGENSSVARVVIVNWYGDVLFDEYIKQTQHVTDLRTFVSGITAEHLEGATLSLRDARKKILKILYGRFLIGHGLKSDLTALGISHPWWLIRDTARYRPFMQTFGPDTSFWPRKLKDLSLEKLGSDIQEIGKPHSPYEDAMAALDLYKTVQKDWEQLMQRKVEKTNAIRAKEGQYQMQQQQQQQNEWARQQQLAYMHLQQHMLWQQQNGHFHSS